MRIVCSALFLSLLAALPSSAQTVQGDWQGTLKAGASELRIVVHVTRDDKGGLKATLDSPDQGASGIPITSIDVAGSTLKFESQPIMGSFEGMVNAGATAIAGTWRQGGMSIPLELTRALPAVEAKNRVAKPSDIDGVWDGTLHPPGATLRLVLHIATYEDGMTAKMDSPDQKAFGIPVSSFARDGASVRYEIKAIGGGFNGTLDRALTTLTGTWSQGGGSLPLVLKRARKAQ